jgi:predicted RNA binding protein YcfA (HicA-like mRNA interferase family)
MAYSPQEIIKVLEANGWFLDRIKGSHHIYKNDELKKSVPIPVHGKKELGKGLFFKILKQCGIDKDDV